MNAILFLSTFLYPTCEITRPEPPLFYWDARPRLGFSNFGDALSEALVERIVGRKITVANEFVAGQKFLAIGSILSYAQDGDLIWGTGVNGKTADNAYHFSHLDVRAVRGPLTREFLLKKGIDCPEVYGDPTLLLPHYFPEFERAKHPTHEYLLIPHFSEEHLFAGMPNLVSVKEDWKTVVEKILNSKFVISSALSGVIVAEAFGIPARLLLTGNECNTENLFKYADYYAGTNRPHFRFAKTVEEALEMQGEELPIYDLERLRAAFPSEFFKRK